MMNGTGNNAKTVTLEVTVDEANVILAGLGELPAKVTIGLITKLQQQAAGQLQDTVSPTIVTDQAVN